MFFDKSVLITDGAARQVLPIAKGFKNLGCKVTIICFSKLDLGYITKYADRKIVLPCKRDDYAFQEKFVLEIIKEENFDLLVPLSDKSAEYLSRNKDIISLYSVAAVNDYDVFNKAANKNITMKLCEDNGIACPKTFFNYDQISNKHFPLVVKPQDGCGSIGFHIVKNQSELSNVLSDFSHKKIVPCIQEYIPQNGSQYGVEIFRDRSGEFSFAVVDEKPRWFPLDGGSPTINISIHNDVIEEMSKKLLDIMDWNGYANIDFVIDSRDGKPKVLEVNPRLSAGTKLNYCLGIDVSRNILENYFSDTITKTKGYKDGISICCCLTEFLWFIKSEDRFKTKPSIWSFHKKWDVIFDKSDIFPFFTFCIQSILGYKKAMKLRKR